MIDKKAIQTWVAFYIGKIEMFSGKERLTTMVMARENRRNAISPYMILYDFESWLKVIGRLNRRSG
jgi:hypothetical protein